MYVLLADVLLANVCIASWCISLSHSSLFHNWAYVFRAYVCLSSKCMSFEHMYVFRAYVCLSKFLRFSSIFPSRFCCTVFLDCVCVPYWPELGKRPHCRDNVTRFSGHKIVMVTAILLYSLWLLNLDTETLIFFEFFLVPETLWRCLVVAKVKYCRVPSSAYCYTISHMKIARLLKYVLINVIDMLIH